MRAVLRSVCDWLEDDGRVALARVCEVVGSGPQRPGAAIALSEKGVIAGSASGGCTDSALVEAAQSAFQRKQRLRLESFSCSGGEHDSGCGGTMWALIERLDLDETGEVDLACLRELATVLGSGEAAALTEIISGPEQLLGGKLLLRADGTSRWFGASLPSVTMATLVEFSRDALAGQGSSVRRFSVDDRARVADASAFVEAYPAQSQMVIVGSGAYAAALVDMARLLGYRTVVCDARPPFATKERFPTADEIVVDWPDRFINGLRSRLGPSDAICVLTHDPKFDIPAIVASLRTKAGYIGLMGSRHTQEARRSELRAMGVRTSEMDRLHGPIGLDLGGRSPEETAVSIIAEIIAASHGRAGVSLSTLDQPIHSAI